MTVFAWLALAVLVPFAAGSVAGHLVRAGDGYQRTPAVAAACALVIVVIVLIVGYATTPQSACSGTGCDTGYGLGAAVLAAPIFLLTLAGVAGGRSLARRRSTVR
jgi:hypothetical protein